MYKKLLLLVSLLFIDHFFSYSSNSLAQERLSNAAQLNQQLSYTLEWDFATRKQKGWVLYRELIAKMVGSQAGINSTSFAEAVMIWQLKNHLPATGVVDLPTWLRMAEIMQQERLSNRTPANKQDLIVAPVIEFYDLERPEEMRKVEKTTYQAYQRMVAAALKDQSYQNSIKNSTGKETSSYFRIISAWRSKEYQEKLRSQQKNQLSRIALAKFSAHFTGRALDIYVGGDPVSTQDSNRAKQVESPAYRWLVHNAPKYGFKPYFFEPWHWEYVEN